MLSIVNLTRANKKYDSATNYNHSSITAC